MLIRCSWGLVFALWAMPLTSQAQSETEADSESPATPAASTEAPPAGPDSTPPAPEAPPPGYAPPPLGPPPGDPNLYCQQTCPLMKGLSCLGASCLGPEQWIAMGKDARKRESSRWRNRWHIGPLVGLSVLFIDSNIDAVGGMGGVHFTHGLGRYLGISLQAALGMGGVIYSPPGKESSEGLTSVSMLSLDATFAIGPFYLPGLAPFFGIYFGPTAGWTNLWYAKNAVEVASRMTILEDGSFLHAGLETGFPFGRRQNLRCYVRIVGAPNSDKTEGAVLVFFSYGFLP